MGTLAIAQVLQNLQRGYHQACPLSPARAALQLRVAVSPSQTVFILLLGLTLLPSKCRDLSPERPIPGSGSSGSGSSILKRKVASPGLLNLRAGGGGEGGGAF